MPAGQVIGRVSIKVLPDTDEFRRRTRQELRTATDGMAVKIKVELDKKSLRDVTDQLRDWHKRVSPLKVQVKPDLAAGSTTYVNKRLAYMTRPRTVPIIPYLNNTAVGRVNKGVAQMVGALSGGRVLKSFLSDLFDTFKRLDKMAPLIGGIGLAISGLAGIAITSVSNLAALAYTLAQIGAVGMTLPAMFASAAIGIGVLVAVFKDFNTILPQVKGQLAALQDQLSAKFWKVAKAPIQDLINGLLPAFSAGLGKTSSALGSFFGTLATSLKGALGPSLPQMFDGLVVGIANAEGAAAPLANIIRNLGTIGASYLPAMGVWVADIAKQFDNWLGKSIDSGQMTQWIENGKQALSDLGQVLKNTFSIFSGLGKAASAGGGSTLSIFADTLERISGIVNGPVFQGGLAAVFDAAHDSIAKITEVAGPALTNFFGTLPELLQAILPVAGQAIGTIGSALATAFANPAFQDGLINMMSGLSQALTAMAPAFGPIGAAIGAIGSALGQLFTTLGPTLGVVLGTLASTLSTLMPALQPIISVLGAGLGGIVKALAPVFLQLVGAITSLMPPIMQFASTLIGALMPVIAQLAPMIGNILTTALRQLAPLFPLVANAIAQIAPLFGDLVAAVLPLVSAVLPPLIAIFSALIPVVVQIVSAVLPPLIQAITSLVTAIAPVLTMVASFVAMLLTALAPVLTFIAQLLMSVVTGIMDGLTSVFTGIMSIFEGFKTMFSGGWSNFLNGLWQVLVGIFELIKGVFLIALNIGILGIVRKGWALIKGIFTSGGGALKGVVMALWNGIKSLFQNGLNGAYSAVVGGISKVKAFFTSGMHNIQFAAATAWQVIKKAFFDGIANAVNLVKTLPSKVTSGLGNLGNTLKGAAADLIGGFIAGIREKFGDVKDTLQGLTKKLTEWKGPEPVDRVLLTPAGELIIDSLINGMESRYDAVRKSLNGLTQDIAATTFQPLDIPSIGNSLAALDADMTGGPAGGAGTQIDLDINTTTDADPEDIADELLFALRRVGTGGVYAKRKGA